ncbi:hypothetical protein Nepgr_020157 [Nepenthes gracilis]|uniref:Uncharacterized protein n=1 Tax=Nepenthes gracilis TaxID=150966 RepID=A0AAD3XW31_NEPGR|nr:hypothetical protein Nepgr_020157 [Nepenthes gracilis]
MKICRDLPPRMARRSPTLLSPASTGPLPAGEAPLNAPCPEGGQTTISGSSRLKTNAASHSLTERHDWPSQVNCQKYEDASFGRTSTHQ